MDRIFTPRPVQLESRGEAKAPTIVGYAAVYYREGDPATEFELWNNAKERIMPGAFDKALAEKTDVRALFNHNPNEILGRSLAGTLELRSDPTGLHYTILAADTGRARDLAEHIRRGDISGSSFSFIPTDVTWQTEGGVDIREIRGVELFDVGPVTFPAYEGTAVMLNSRMEALQQEAAEYRAANTKPYVPSRLGYLKRAALVERLTRSIFVLP